MSDPTPEEVWPMLTVHEPSAHCGIKGVHLVERCGWPAGVECGGDESAPPLDEMRDVLRSARAQYL